MARQYGISDNVSTTCFAMIMAGGRGYAGAYPVQANGKRGNFVSVDKMYDQLTANIADLFQKGWSREEGQRQWKKRLSFLFPQGLVALQWTADPPPGWVSESAGFDEVRQSIEEV